MEGNRCSCFYEIPLNSLLGFLRWFLLIFGLTAGIIVVYSINLIIFWECASYWILTNQFIHQNAYPQNSTLNYIIFIIKTWYYPHNGWSITSSKNISWIVLTSNANALLWWKIFVFKTADNHLCIALIRNATNQRRNTNHVESSHSKD